MTTTPAPHLTLPTALLACATLATCGYDAPANTPDPADTGVAAMSVETFSAAIQTLSSDEFEGRGPSTPGEETTVAYLVEQFQAAGLEPGNGDSFFQNVPLVALTEQGQPGLTVRAPDARLSYTWSEDFVAWTKRVVESESIDDSEMVFVGYGVVASEYGWNDYDGVDAAGKTVVILVNDPGFATQDEAVFRGNSMTYYGRWTYKFEEAARQGAAGAIVVHEEAAAGYPWAVVSGGWTGPQFDQAGEDGDMGRVQVEGWVQTDVAREIFTASGFDFDALAQAATRPDFQAVPLGATASVAVSFDIQRSESRNVLALLRGSESPDEYIIYTAHWDHFGRGPDTMEDPIFNGAFDNATGTAGLIELARAFGALPERPARSVLFLAVTAEEQGLLGSAYYAANPVYPTASTVATINIDGMNVDGPMNDITVVGMGASGTGRLSGGGGQPGGTHPAARPRAREGVLLPLRPLQLREGRRPLDLHRFGDRPRRARHGMDAGTARRLHKQPLPQGDRRVRSFMGSDGRARRPGTALPGGVSAGDVGLLAELAEG